MKSLKRRWRRLEVRLQKSRRVQTLLQRVYAAYIDFVFRTTRWEKIGFESYEADIARGVPRVLCCWHSRLALTPYLRDWTDHKLTVMASGHADARIASAGLKQRGIGVIELATSGDNALAVRDAVRAVRAGGSLGVTVDGPFGPAGQAKPGALVIAGLARVEAAPCTFATSRNVKLRTWDRFVLPLPWSRGVLAVADGFVPPPRLAPQEMEDACHELSRRIDELTARCEARLKSQLGSPPTAR